MKADLPGFEPGSEAPEASVISKLHYRPLFGNKNLQYYVFLQNIELAMYYSKMVLRHKLIKGKFVENIKISDYPDMLIK